MPGTFLQSSVLLGLNVTTAFYNSSCPGLCCFENFPCQYSPCKAALEQEEAVVTFKPNNTEDCKKVPGINTDLGIIYNSSCPGLCCFENFPCQYSPCTA